MALEDTLSGILGGGRERVVVWALAMEMEREEKRE